MRMNILWDRLGGLLAHITPRVRLALAGVAMSLALSACGIAPPIPPAEQPLSKETVELLAKKGMRPESPMFVRIFKEESELEVWKARDDGRYYHFKTYPICNWSGELGPKQIQGDKQAPEGFYTVSETQMNPNSKFYLAFNLGYPNAYDRSLGRTGDAVMMHGKCKSAGCYAMTDALAEEIYALARESFRGGQKAFEVHAMPFHMTNEKLARYKGHKWFGFWNTLKQGYDYFEVNRLPPPVTVCQRQYVVNAVAKNPAQSIDPAGRCPALERPGITPFVPSANSMQLASERIVIPGPKSRIESEVAAQTASVAAADAAGSPFGTWQPTAGNGVPPGASALGYNQ